MKLSNQIAFKSIFFQIIITFVVRVINHFINTTSSESIFVFETVLSQLMVYFTDILFIQEKFNQTSSTPIPKTLTEKLKYSINKNIIYKFIVIVGISRIINTNMYHYIILNMNKRNLLSDKKLLRNSIVQLLVNVFTTISYMNIIKFKWAYINNEDPVLNMIIISWFSLSILISVSRCSMFTQ